MQPLRTRLVVAAAIASIAALAGCSAGDAGGNAHEGHDHSAHEAGSTHADDGHAGHDHGTKGTASTGGPVPADTAPTLTKIEPSADYPLTACVVSGDALDAMDERLAFKYGDEEVQFCCEGCIDEFKENPESFMQKVRAAKAR